MDFEAVLRDLYLLHFQVGFVPHLPIGFFKPFCVGFPPKKRKQKTLLTSLLLNFLFTYNRKTKNGSPKTTVFA